MSELERELAPFAAAASVPPPAVVARLRRDRDGLHYRLAVTGSGLAVPEADPDAPERRDGLWRQTCAELFVAEPGRPGYLEWNLSPSGHWNLYRFDDYRAGGRPAELSGPAGPTVSRAEPGLVIRGFLPLAPFGLASCALEVAACAVVAMTAGDLTYWAPAHPAARPDFHDRRGFTLRLDPCHGNPGDHP